MRALPFLALTLVALAGCDAPSDDAPTTGPTTTSPPPPPPAALTFTGCQGFHTFFPSPAAPFESFVPENFTLDGDGPTVQVAVFGFDCGNGTAEMWALLPVIPPADYAPANGSYAVDAVILEAITTNATHHGEYVAWGLEPDRLNQASVRETEYLAAGVAHTDRIALGTADLRYQVRTSVQDAGGSFGAETYRYWVTNGTRATGWAEVEAAESTNVGAGSAVFESEGDEGAPPFSGGVGHRVADLAYTMRHTPLQ